MQTYYTGLTSQKREKFLGADPRWLKTEFLIFFPQYTISSFLPAYPGQSPETINHLSEGITFLLLGFHFHCKTFFTGILHRLFILQAERKSILLELWNQNHCGFDSWFYYLLCLWSKTVSPSSHSWGGCDTGYLWEKILNAFGFPF